MFVPIYTISMISLVSFRKWTDQSLLYIPLILRFTCQSLLQLYKQNKYISRYIDCETSAMGYVFTTNLTLPKVYSHRVRNFRIRIKKINQKMFKCSCTVQLPVDFSNNRRSSSGSRSIIRYSRFISLSSFGLYTCWNFDFNRYQLL